MDNSMWRWIADESAINLIMAGLATWMLIGNIAICILVLSKGADWMIDGVVALAQRTGLPKVVIGATIVSLGTTTPEAFVSVMAAWMGNPGLALGNGVGSIIADTGLIFGLTCLLTAVPMNRFILNRTGWVQVGSATLLVVISAAAWLLSGGNPVLGRSIGIGFLVLLAGYMYMTYRWARQEAAAIVGVEIQEAHERMSVPHCCVLIFAGLVLVIISARVLIPAASELALRLGVPDDVVAATMVAFGTSLPELMTAITAVRKGHPEITLGNIVGADVLNCLFVIGAAAAARPLAVPPTFFYFHFPAMLIILGSFRWFISINHDNWFKTWQGAWLLAVYCVYVLLQYTTGASVHGA
ncbi:MAG: sodium:calcium antiporter [Desulfobacterales bacterium]